MLLIDARLPTRGPVIVTLTLVAHIGVFYSLPESEKPPPSRALRELPQKIGQWTMAAEYPIEQDVLKVLRADDTLHRVYQTSAAQASLFIAFFQSQRAGQAPHSPKNCLPGAGWTPVSSGTLRLRISGRVDWIEVNRYIVERDASRSMVLYWHQSHGRVVASEYANKFFLVADSIRLKRSDTALVRVIVPITNGDFVQAERAAGQFVRDSFRSIGRLLPA